MFQFKLLFPKDVVKPLDIRETKNYRNWTILKLWDWIGSSKATKKKKEKEKKSNENKYCYS